MKNRQVAVIPSKGIGDALLMMIASHQLLLHGYEVTTFHEKLKELQDWFVGHRFAKKETLETGHYELIIAQNDNSPFISSLIEKARAPLSIFYPSYHSYKHAPLFKLDQVFNAAQPMADNIAASISRLLGGSPSKENGLCAPNHLTHRKYQKRIVLHPTSSLPSKNWSPVKFLKVAAHLKRKGYEPVFAVSMEEKKAWDFLSFELQAFDRLDALAAFLFESGGLIGNDSLLGHLASNLQIPTLVIADNPHLLALWRPGWLLGAVVTPPAWVPSKIRERFWRSLISSKKVANYFS
ncbi:MAG TPA: glycosyltransferase family 9 protein [Rhabdochlamydiaceae bacterium]|nr:glycosyltransferase family 9 protein [Rhabdochlamydiaceae bacterium]